MPVHRTREVDSRRHARFRRPRPRARRHRPRTRTRSRRRPRSHRCAAGAVSGTRPLQRVRAGRRRGQVVLRKGYGLANMEWGIANTPDTKFRLGSITKQFTATLVMQLVEKGQIDLSAPITRYLPDYPAKTGAASPSISFSITRRESSDTPSFLPSAKQHATRTLRRNSPRVLRQARSPVRARHEIQLQQLGVLPARRHSREGDRPAIRATASRAHLYTTRDARLGYDSTRPLLARRASGYDKQFDGTYVNTGYLDMTQPYAAGSFVFDGRRPVSAGIRRSIPRRC